MMPVATRAATMDSHTSDFRTVINLNSEVFGMGLRITDDEKNCFNDDRSSFIHEKLSFT